MRAAAGPRSKTWVAICAVGNFGRMDTTLEEMGLVDLRTRPVVKTD